MNIIGKGLKIKEESKQLMGILGGWWGLQLGLSIPKHSRNSTKEEGSKGAKGLKLVISITSSILLLFTDLRTAVIFLFGKTEASYPFGFLCCFLSIPVFILKA